MTIARPAAALTVTGSGGPGLPGGALGMAEGAVRRLRIDLSVDENHDRVVLELWPGSRLGSAHPGDELAVGLGTGDGDPQDVLSADVVGVDEEAAGTVLLALAQSHRLSFTHVGRSWRSTTLGQVVRDLLDDGGADAGDVDASLSLPALHVDPHRSVWSALHDLARRTGNQITSRTDGKVSFGAAPGVASGGGLGGALGAAAALAGLGGSDELREGADLIAFRAGTRPSRTATERVSPAGAKAWFLLESAPDNGSDVQIVDPALRTREAADAGSSGATAAASRATKSARVRVPGRPDFRAGGTIRARGEDYRVLRATHLLDAHAGYLCDLLLEGAS